VKRELLALQKLGERLTREGPKVIARMPLSDEMLAALDEAKRIKSHNALRRHYRRLCKLLRQEELEAIQHQADGSYLALARMKVVDFNRQTGLNLHHPRGEKGLTVGGLLINVLGRTVHKGDQVAVNGYWMEAVEVSGLRVVRVRIIPPAGDRQETPKGNGEAR